MSSLRYESHEVVLEPERWQLQVGGEVVTAEPKVFELLSYMMRHSGRVVSKAELLDALWAGDVVGESVLTRCVSCVRKLLADDSKTPRFIRTLHGRGYEFIAPVSAKSLSTPVGVAASAPARAAATSVSPGPQGERVLVGRGAETRHLREALLQLEARRGDFILVSGEAGIGKTRLLEDALSAAPPSLDVHYARCSAVEGAPAFQVWQQCFRSLVRTRSIKVVRRALEHAPSGARKLLLGTDGWQAGDQLGWDSPAERFRTFDAIGRGLGELAAQRPLALVLDDLHAADLVSLLLLEFLLQASPGSLLVLGTLRDSEQPTDAARAEALLRLRGTCKNELRLVGLTRDEVERFVELRLQRPDAALAASLFSRTGGNPFFLSVLTPSAGAAATAGMPLPTAVQQAVAQRLAALDGACVALLKTAAACGPSFDVVVLARATGLPSERCLALLNEGCAARVIAQAGAGEYRFVHDLNREVLYADLSPSERPAVHLAIGRALAALPAFQDARQAAVLAHHFLEAALVGGADRALDQSIRAGAYALRNFAYEEAIEHFDRATRLLPLAAERDPATECALLLDLGLARISAGQREAGQGTLLAAAEKARELGGGSELSSVALHLAPGLFAIETGVFDPVLVGLLREAIAQARQMAPGRQALLAARLALALYWSDTFGERVALCNQAQALAEQDGSDQARAAVATANIFALLRPSNLAERRVLSDQAIELCQRAGDHDGLLMNRVLRAAMFMESADMAAARYETEAFRALAETTNQPQSLWIVSAQQACRLLLDGRLDEVEQLAGACMASGQRVRDHNALLTFGVHLTLVRVEQLRVSEVLEVIRDFSARYPRIVGWRVLYAFALLRAEQAGEAEAEYRSLKGVGFALPDDLNWMVSMAWLAELSHTLGDADDQRVLYGRLLPYADRLVVVGYAGIACLGSVERYLALLASKLEAGDVVRGHFQRALDANRRASATLPLLHTLCDYADWLKAAGSSAEARALAEEARPLVEERNLSGLRARLK